MSMRFMVRCLAVAGLLLSAHVADAQQGQTPAQILNTFPNGGQAMEDQVQALVKADKANLARIIEYARNATEDQRKSIAKGLYLAAKAYAAGSSDDERNFGNKIQTDVASSGIPEFAKAYAEAAGDTGTASTGGGGGGGGPTAGGPPTGGTNTGTLFPGTTSTATQSAGLTNSTLGTIGNTSVSP